ncbi:hypothetical protein Droror1_Dr00007975 [Drosera rotundifolia]
MGNSQSNPQNPNPNPPARDADPNTLDSPTPSPSNEQNAEKAEEGGEEEEDGECAFCIYMKGGGCKESFTEFEKCISGIDKDDGDLAAKCGEVMGRLRWCMEANKEYYRVMLKKMDDDEDEKRLDLENDGIEERAKE